MYYSFNFIIVFLAAVNHTKAKKLYHWYGGWEHGFSLPTVKEMEEMQYPRIGGGSPHSKISRGGTTKEEAKATAAAKGGKKKRGLKKQKNSDHHRKVA